MKIIVCIKQVPDTTEIRLNPKTNTLMREGVPSIINPDDKSALEEALRLKEQHGAHITVLSMGPAQADAALREALAMGCDEAVLVSGREFGGSDTFATATILAAAVQTMDYDLVLCGRQAIDGDTAQVGPQLAERLGVPQVSYVQAIEAQDGALVVNRQFEDRVHRIRVKTPCLLTLLSEIAAPRYMTVGGIVDAYEKTVRVLSFDDLKEHLNPEHIGLQGSPTRVISSQGKEPRGAGTKLDNLSVDEAVKTIVDKLEQLHIIG